MGWLREWITERRQAGPHYPNAWEERDPGKGILWRSWGMKTAWWGTTRIVWKKCPDCTGGGQVLLDGWGEMPPHARNRLKDRTQPSVANFRNCDRCHGLGHCWVPEEE